MKDEEDVHGSRGVEKDVRTSQLARKQVNPPSKPENN